MNLFLMITGQDEVKMVLYNALPKKEYERIFMCKTAKDVWNSLVITHQVTSLKALDESFSSRNHVRKFLRALPTKWCPKVTAIEESKDLSTLHLDELIGNLKVYEVVLEKDSEVTKNKKEQYKSLALKAKKNLRRAKEDKKGKEERRCFKCGDPNHFISDYPKHSFNDQKAFVGGCWSDSEEEDDSNKDGICLMAHDNNEVRLKVKLEPDEWIKDSGCSRHMTGNKDLFSTYEAVNGGNVVFGSNTKSKIIDKGHICDKKCKVLFSETGSEILKDDITIGRWIRKSSLYVMKIGNSSKDSLCLTSTDDTSTLWHRRLDHANMRLIQSLSSKELVRNLPKLKFKNHFCDACNIGKQVHARHKAKNMVSTTKCLELLHMNLFGPSAVQSYRGNYYTLVTTIQVQKGCPIMSIRTDHGREFDNEVQFGAFYDANGITHNFSAPRTPQSNRVVERMGLETIVYADSNHAGDYVDCKSTSGVCTFMGCCLTSWFSRKQTAISISTIEAEYVSAGKACKQALWMKQALIDYEIKLDDIPVLCDNKDAIDLSKNHVFHFRTKHIEIRHHILRDNIQKGNISIEKVFSEDNIADILTKPLKREPLNLLRLGLGLMEPNA
ncbi:retrovirus-related pol polyprotein from transposon TNT 1-94 [Tanacetum coccineum]